jgi:hypothetical protein
LSLVEKEGERVEGNGERGVTRSRASLSAELVIADQLGPTTAQKRACTLLQREVDEGTQNAWSEILIVDTFPNRDASLESEQQLIRRLNQARHLTNNNYTSSGLGMPMIPGGVTDRG